MARLDEDKIISAAEAFVAEHGRTPTYEELQEKLGVKSPTTLNKYYRPWRAKRDEELKEQPPQVPPPVEQLTTALIGAWSAVVAETRTEARREIEEAQLQLKSRLEQLMMDLAERDATISALEQQGETNQEEFDSERAALQSRIEAQAAELAARSAEIARTSELLSAERQKTDMLAGDLDLARRETASERSKADAATGRAAALEMEVRKQNEDLAAIRQEAATEREKANDLARQVAGLTADLTRLSTDVEHARTQHESLSAALADARKELAGAQGRGEVLSRDLEAARHDVMAERTRADAAAARLEGLATEIQRLTAALESQRQRTGDDATSPPTAEPRHASPGSQ
jgi:chromosome segregation ATPase